MMEKEKSETLLFKSTCDKPFAWFLVATGISQGGFTALLQGIIQSPLQGTTWLAVYGSPGLQMMHTWRWCQFD